MTDFNKLQRYDFPYNEDQVHAIDSFNEFLKNKDEQFFILSGAAGTGKSEVTKELIRSIKRRGTVCVTAPTHKAKRVTEQITNIKGKTCQQLLKLRPNFNLDNFDINKIIFDESRFSHDYIADYFAIMVDEAGMIGNSLKDLFIRKATKYKTKLIFVGDPYQLPPVNHDYSPIFRMKCPKFNLTKVVRQEGDNPLLDLLNIIRLDIRNGTTKGIAYIYKEASHFNDRGEGYITYKSNDLDHLHYFQEETLKYFDSETFENNINWCKFTSYTNEKILLWNQFIRDKLLNHPTDLVIKGDLLMCYKTIVDEFMSPIIINSEDYLVDSVERITKPDMNIEGFKVVLTNVYDLTTTKPLFIVDTKSKKNVINFLKIHNLLRQKARTSDHQNRYSNWNKYYGFKDNNLLIEDIKDDRGELLIAKDLSYSFSVTTHKTQGSTYNNIFTNLRDIAFNKYGSLRSDVNLVNRLLYVALSRAKEKAFLLI